MYYVQALYETRSGKQIAGPRHLLPGIRKAFKRSMSRGDGCTLAKRYSNNYLSREKLVELIDRVGLVVNATRADFAVFQMLGDADTAMLATQANCDLSNLAETQGVLLDALSQCQIDDDILHTNDPHIKALIAKNPPRTKRISRIRLALA